MARDAHRHFPKGGFLPTAKGGLMGESEEVPKGGLMWERARSEEVRSQCLNLNFCDFCSLSDLPFTMCCTGGWVHAALPLSVDGTPGLARCRDSSLVLLSSSSFLVV